MKAGQQGPEWRLKAPAGKSPLTREKDPQAQQNQGPEEAHVERDAQLATRTLASGLVLHAQGHRRLRGAGLPAPPSPQALHVHIGVILTAGAADLLLDPRWEGGMGTRQ